MVVVGLIELLCPRAFPLGRESETVIMYDDGACARALLYNVNTGNLSGKYLFSIIDLKFIINLFFFMLDSVESTGLSLRFSTIIIVGF